MRWGHVDFKSGRVVLPHTKTGKRIHDLPRAVIDVLDELRRREGADGDHVFGSRPGGAVSYKTVRGVFARAAERAGLENVRLHDLRRTALTTAAMAGFTGLMVQELAGHKTMQMAARYVRLAGSRAVKSAREQVGATISALMDGAEPPRVTGSKKLGEDIP